MFFSLLLWVAFLYVDRNEEQLKWAIVNEVTQPSAAERNTEKKQSCLKQRQEGEI